MSSDDAGDEVQFPTACQSLEDPRVRLTEAMTTLCGNYTSLDLIEQTKSVLEACVSNNAVSKAAYQMYQYRANLLR